MNENNQDSNWKKLLGFRNMQEKLEKLFSANICQLYIFISVYKFQVINKIIPIRMHEWEELVGADFFEHDIRHPNVGVSR